MPDPATARRVIFSTYVVPQESLVTEEGVTKYAIEGGAGRTYGGKGTATLTPDQWGEGWTSMNGPQQYWENMDNNWEDEGGGWSGIQTVSSATSLNPDSASASAPVLFLYIRNLGTSSTQSLKVSLDGTNYKICIPPKGSLSLRGDGTTLQMEDVKVDKVTLKTEIEFIIAK
jgi:hypothetical protein|tara:strand:+ start:742 stop:1257 length:516 start_codon:yes stop_codon:yes gene_type:complete